MAVSIKSIWRLEGIRGLYQGVTTLCPSNQLGVMKMCLVLQYNATPSRGQYRDMLDALVNIYHPEGLSGLYMGFLLGFFSTSQGALQFMAYEEGIHQMQKDAVRSSAGQAQHLHQPRGPPEEDMETGMRVPLAFAKGSSPPYSESPLPAASTSSMRTSPGSCSWAFVWSPRVLKGTSWARSR